jgi:hypothetical protein
MNTPAQDTARYLVAEGVAASFGGAADWSAYVGREPLAPDNVVTVYDTGGPVGPLVDLRRPSIQVRVRSVTYETGWEKANEILQTLVQPFQGVSVPDATILVWDLSTDVMFIGHDDADRPLFTVNFQILRDGVST